MKKIVLLFTLVIITKATYCQLQGQKKVDSLIAVLKTTKQDTTKVNVLNDLAYQFRGNNPDTAIYFAGEALALATKLNNETGIIYSYLIMGIANKNLGNYEAGLKISLEALKLCDQQLVSEKAIDKSKILNLKAGAYNNLGNINEEQGNYSEALKSNIAALKVRIEIDDKLGIASSYNNIGNIYGDLGNYAEALKNFFAALKIKEEAGDKKSIANSYNNIGSTYYNQGQYKQALEYHLIALKIRKENGDKSGIASSYNNIGIIYDDEANYAEALKYHLASLEIMKEINDPQGIALSYNNIGLVYMHQNDNEKALEYFLDYLKISEEIEDVTSTADAYINTGSIYAKLKKNSVAAVYLNKGLLLSKEVGNPEIIKAAYLSLAKIDSAQGNYKQALEHFKLYTVYHDSIFNDENNKILIQSQMQYEFDKKESLANAEQKKKDAVALNQKRIRNYTITFLGVLIFAVAIIAFILFRNNKHKQKMNMLLQRKNEKVETTLAELKSTQSQLIQQEKLASLGALTAGIAHEIKNPLNFVNNFSELSTELVDEFLETTDEKERKEIGADLKLNLQKINEHGKRADSIVKNMLAHSRTGSSEKQLTDINKLCNEYLNLAFHGKRASNPGFNCEMIKQFDNNLPQINCVTQDISRVILNLIGNAFDAVRQREIEGESEGVAYHPTVTVITKSVIPNQSAHIGTSSHHHIIISVKDNGKGIPSHIKEKIFEPFFTTKAAGQGTGLGLSLSNDIVKAHGGEINVTTEANNGSEFVITLPL